MSTESHRKKIWDIPKTQKAFKPLHEDEMEWLADSINSDIGRTDAYTFPTDV